MAAALGYHGQHLSAAAAYSHELIASGNGSSYSFMCVIFPVIGLVMSAGGGPAHDPAHGSVLDPGAAADGTQHRSRHGGQRGARRGTRHQPPSCLAAFPRSSR